MHLHSHLPLQPFRAANGGTGCAEVMAALEDCHARGFLHKVVGGCNDAKLAVNRCLRAERLERTARNREQAKIERQKIKRAWKEIDDNS